MRRHGLISRGALALCLLLAAAGAWAMPVFEITAGIHRIEAEVAATNADREQGLMYRKAMAEHHGMLFVFPRAGIECMWMRNTLLPLSVAFLDDKGSILNIEDMQPQTTTNHCAARPARYALEMNLGWFARRGLVRGHRISGLDALPPAQ
jgi:uncharacterized membrane protein (UPF0127 family)